MTARAPRTFRPLYLLAFDHRQVLRDLLGRPGQTREAEGARFAEAKMMVVDAVSAAVAHGIPESHVGVLVDEEYGTTAALAAQSAGMVLAMPVEASRTTIFELQYGPDFATHVDRFHPDIVKLLVVHNPQDPQERQDTQMARVGEVCSWAHEAGYPVMLELLLRPTAGQLTEAGGDQDRFWSVMHPALIVESVRQFQRRGIEPDIWKLEGLPTTAAFEAVAAACRTEGRNHVDCIVLGSGASVERVEQWLRQGSAVSGFSGFAVGRSVWLEPLRSYYAGEIGREDAVTQISRTFRRLIDAFEGSSLTAPHA